MELDSEVKPRPATQADLRVTIKQADLKATATATTSSLKPRKDKIVCRHWIQGKCRYADDKCKFLHSWTIGDDVSLMSSLQGHKKSVTGIVLPSGSDKLYTGSTDGKVRVWDCVSGKCVRVINLGGEVGCVIHEGHWVFVGVPNAVKALNTQKPDCEMTTLGLRCPARIGQVYAMVVGNDVLFAGTHTGSILSWRFSPVTNSFEPAESLKGHTLGVASLAVGGVATSTKRHTLLYSGSFDGSIRVWTLESLQCIQTLAEHTSVVTSLICSDQCLFSCALDQTLKIWAPAAATDQSENNDKLEVKYTHSEEYGLLALCGMHDSEGKPVLLCSCNDNILRLYDLPSFSQRGRVFAKQEIRVIQAAGPHGLVFTGDGTGAVRVWKWGPAKPVTVAAS